MDGHLWTPLQIWSLLPNERHGPSKLYIGEKMLLALLLSQKNHLRFCSIGTIAIEVTPSNDPPLPLPSLVPASNQGNVA